MDRADLRRDDRRRIPAVLLVTALVLVMASVGMFWRFAMPTIQLEAANSPGAVPAFIPTAVSVGVPQRPVNTAGHVVSGNAPGLYGGSTANTCDVAAMRDFLATHPAQASAWAQSLMINTGQIPTLLSSLTPLTLRTDTAVTNHGFDNGVAMPFQSVLQAGTAVLVDAVGLPRVRCYCGNPLQVPSTTVIARYEGVRWTGFESETVTTIDAAPQAVDDFVVVKPDTNEIVTRPRGTRGQGDRAADERIVQAVRSGPIGQATGGGSSAPASSGSSASPAAPAFSVRQPAIAGSASASASGTAPDPPASGDVVSPSASAAQFQTLAPTEPTTSIEPANEPTAEGTGSGAGLAGTPTGVAGADTSTRGSDAGDPDAGQSGGGSGGGGSGSGSGSGSGGGQPGGGSDDEDAAGGSDRQSGNDDADSGPDGSGDDDSGLGQTGADSGPGGSGDDDSDGGQSDDDSVGDSVGDSDGG